MPHILLLEDDAGLRHGLGQQLHQEGFTHTSLDRVADALAFIRQQAAGHGPQADAALLGLSLVDGEGLEVLQSIRAAPSCRSLPVILVAGQADGIHWLLELEVGADDYLAKPFSSREMVARLKALLRRASFMNGEADDRDLCFGPIEVDLEQFAARAAGAPLLISPGGNSSCWRSS